MGDLDVDQVRQLAHTLGELLPYRIIGRQSEDLCGEMSQVTVRLETACCEAGVEDLDAMLIADTLTSHLLGWGRRYGTLDDEVDRGQAVLNLAASGWEDDEWMVLPEGTELQDDTIARLIAWQLLVELPEE